MLLIDTLRDAMANQFRSEERILDSFLESARDNLVFGDGTNMLSTKDEKKDFFSYYTEIHVGIRGRERWDAIPVYEIDEQSAEQLIHLGNVFLSRGDYQQHTIAPHETCFFETRIDGKRIGAVATFEQREKGTILIDSRTHLLKGMPDNFLFAIWRETDSPQHMRQISDSDQMNLYKHLSVSATYLGVEWVSSNNLIETMFKLFIGLSLGLQHPEWFERHQVDRSRINKARQKNGRFSLASYTSIRLGTPFQDESGYASDSAHDNSAGRRLHPVRAFPRLRNGNVELVRSHFRGDPSLGIVNLRRIRKKTPPQANDH